MKKKDEITRAITVSTSFIIQTVNSLPSSYENLELLQATHANIERLQAVDNGIFGLQVASEALIEAIQKHSDKLAYEGV